ncbi:hypothetical protein HL653_03215 [Sphingomonas sp. AP4-R1]|uniref:hypothetical protein n=1 Tax=Sphingomonas sp. AP4-R1 TaxID=2735134 RepID=UPI0014939083|nr:hypothetical protein [Sphingomonas sp. AP4-R1]QJU56932.1 hypothetical protein HL653_03215 [Sphingomonas sp. AP4-R1]
MPNDRISQLLSLIGEILNDDTKYPIENTLLYVEVEPGMVSSDIFKDGGTNVIYRWVLSSRLTEALLDLWEAADPDKRWAEMEHVIRDGTFHAHFSYPGEIDKEEDEFERRTRIVKRYFGDRPIVYPPLPEPGQDLREFEL